MITISLCMIMKNEEAVLARCLDSIANLVDEIILVDTGSTDNTKLIAAKYTDKVYDFEWIDDFAAARNFSMEKATKDYIYVADADEVIDETNRKRFLQLKEALLPEIEVVQMKYTNQLEFGSTYNFDEEYRPKLFKRLRKFYYEDPIHETIVTNPVVYDSDIEILHMPLNNHAKRDFSVFQKAIKRGYTLSKKLHSMYAKELFIAGEDEDFLEASSFFSESIVDSSRDMDQVQEAACVLARVGRITRNWPLFFKATLNNMVTKPCAEICCELGRYYYELQDYNEAVVWYYNAAFETESILSLLCITKIPLSGLIQCYEAMGDKEQVAFYQQKLSEG